MGIATRSSGLSQKLSQDGFESRDVHQTWVECELVIVLHKTEAVGSNPALPTNGR